MSVLSRWCTRQHVDVLFSQEYYLPLFRPRHTVLLLQDATFFDDSRALRHRLSRSERLTLLMKKRWCYHSAAGANRILVQSDSMARLVAKKVPSARSRISVVHHGPGFLDGPQRPMYRTAASDSLEIAYVALYRGYKNFEVLLRALRLLQREGVAVRLHLTLDLVEDPGARMVMSYARKIGVEHSIVNHGELEPDGVAQVYQSAHVFVFPSVCESFGFPQIEAMALGLPVLAADTAVNRELCGPAAIFFAPDDDHVLAAQLKRLYQNPAELAVLAKRSAGRGRDFDWTEAAKKTLECLVDAHQ